MTYKLTCRHCQETIIGSDEDDLVVQVQAHVAAHARERGRSHTVSVDEVRSRRLRHQDSKNS
jgi:hypothetical protein